MAYTVRQVAGLSGVSVRTLRFYDELGLLKPAYLGSSGYRYYEEPQLLTLQQILFYRELGFELKEIKGILGRADFEKAAALESHRSVLEKNLARTQALIATIDKTIEHVRGNTKMSSEEMFAGFRVASGEARFDEEVTLRGEPVDCKVSGRDTGGAICIFEWTGLSSGPRRVHRDQDEWIYVIDGELRFVVGEKQFQAGAGASVFVPRQTTHAWASANGRPARIIDIYQPAGRMEEFFRKLSKYNAGLPIHEVLSFDEFCQLFREHGMEVTGTGLGGEKSWRVEAGRIVHD